MNTKKSVFGDNNPLARPASRYLNVGQAIQESHETHEKITEDDYHKHLKQNTIQKEKNHNHIENDLKDEKHISYVKKMNHGETTKDRNLEPIQTDDDSDLKENPILNHPKHLKQNTIQKEKNHNHIENDLKDEKHISYVKEMNHGETTKDRNPEPIQTDDDFDLKENPILKHPKHLKNKKRKPEVIENAPTKLKESFFISSNTMDRARNAVFSMPGVTLSGTVEEALEMWLRSKERTNGGPFPERTCRIKTGRPMSR